MSYNDPEFQIKRELVLPAPAAGAAGTTKTAIFAAAKLLQAQAVVKAAGTSATSGSYLQILDGTTTLGTLLTGSATAGTVVTAALSGNAAAGDVLQVLQGTDATGSVYGVTIQYQEAVV